MNFLNLINVECIKRKHQEDKIRGIYFYYNKTLEEEVSFSNQFVDL